MPKNNNRPVFLNLARIRLPIAALISIAHRVAGMVLFLSIPFAIYLLDLSLGSQLGYNHVQGLLGHVPIKIVVILVFWALAHHVFAGVRVLLIDFGLGVERDEARRTAWVVAIGSTVSLLMIAGILLW
jgi:succinate dehydrogenase / fumarate reductase cytochrome b subunit